MTLDFDNAYAVTVTYEGTIGDGGGSARNSFVDLREFCLEDEDGNPVVTILDGESMHGVDDVRLDSGGPGYDGFIAIIEGDGSSFTTTARIGFDI